MNTQPGRLSSDGKEVAGKADSRGVIFLLKIEKIKIYLCGDILQEEHP